MHVVCIIQNFPQKLQIDPCHFFFFLPFFIVSSVKNACRDATLSNQRTRPALHRARLANWRIIQTSPRNVTVRAPNATLTTIFTGNSRRKERARAKYGSETHDFLLVNSSPVQLLSFLSLLSLFVETGREQRVSCRGEHAKFAFSSRNVARFRETVATHSKEGTSA